MSDIFLPINQKLRQWTQSCPGIPATGCLLWRIRLSESHWNPSSMECSHKRQPCYIEDSQTGRWRSRSDSKRISLEAPDQNCQAHFLLGTPPAWEENWQSVPKTNSGKHLKQKEVVSGILSGKKFSAENLGLSLVHPLVTYTSLSLKRLKSWNPLKPFVRKSTCWVNWGNKSLNEEILEKRDPVLAAEVTFREFWT